MNTKTNVTYRLFYFIFSSNGNFDIIFTSIKVKLSKQTRMESVTSLNVDYITTLVVVQFN